MQIESLSNKHGTQESQFGAFGELIAGGNRRYFNENVQFSGIYDLNWLVYDIL